jgi:two-component system cell cycle sensor histidine kinase/response regulator CckA
MTKILAIDDKPDNLTALSAILKNYIPDCTVITAQSGPEGIEKAITELPDTILMDIKMPGMDGYEACKKIKANEATRHIPIAMITAIRTESVDISRGLDIGADAFLAKPIDETVLVAQVNTLLRIKKAEDKLRGQRDLLEKMVRERTDALAESEAKYRLLADSTIDCIWLLNMDLIFTYINPAVYEMTGFTTKEWIGSKLQGHCDEKNFKIMNGIVLAAQERLPDNSGFIFEAVMLKKSKDPFYVEITGRMIVDEDGQPKGLQGVTRDITERKQAEIALRESEERFRMLFENAPLGYHSLDANGAIVEVNETWCKLLGYTKEEVVGRNFSNFIHPDFEEVFKQNFPKFKSLGYTLGVEFEMIKKDGSEAIVSFDGKIGYKKDGSFKQTHCVLNDLTERNQTKKEKEKLTEQLIQAQKMEAIGTLAGGIAHDFNNILSSILGFTELALDDANKEPLLYDNLTEVLTAGNRAKDLVQQILALSRHDSPEIRPIQINSIVNEVLKMLRSTIPSSIEIQENICSNQLVVLADPTQIHQVIVNLATNAKHAMSDAIGVLAVNVDIVSIDESTQEIDMAWGDYARITISDTGAGIPKTHLDKIFEPYFTTKPVGEGTGLGLSVVHGIIKSHKGNITVSSEPGIGTTFNVFLPLAKQQSAGLPSPIAEPLPTGTERILLVDDELPIVKMSQQTLVRLGYTVTPRTSSIEALEAFRSSPDAFDLVITDMSMPYMTGEKLASEIKKIRPDMPVILCTGFSEKINIQPGPDFQINGFLMKPVVKSKLAKIIRKLLDKTQ